MSHSSGAPSHLYSLDALRGIAALSVVVWHWQHLFYQGTGPPANFVPQDQPLYGLLFLFYSSGSRAVDLFFSLSGFVFFWLYSEAISSGSVSPLKFFVLRFSRLYPLHFLTCLVVVFCQIIYRGLHDDYFVYGNNDAWHLILNLLMISSIGLEEGFSFNAPVWSVSVEVILYAIFYLYCRLARPSVASMLLLSMIGFAGISALYEPIGRGIGSFFLGGLVYRAFLKVHGASRSVQMTGIIVVVTSLLWLFAFVGAYFGFSLRAVPWVWRLSTYYPVCVLFPMTILALALIDRRISIVGTAFSHLGRISYSSYLWHFPLQLVFVLALPSVRESRSWFYSSTAFIGFFVILILLSWTSYKYLEMPLQLHIRRRYRV